MNLPPPPTKTSTAAPPAKDFAIGKVKAGATRWRVVLNCSEGWGKTSCMAHAPKPLIVMCGREIGFRTLREHDRVPDCDTVHVESWPDYMGLLRSDATAPYSTVCIDSLGSLFALLREHVIATKFSGDAQKYQSFGRGTSACETEWNTMLDAIERMDADMVLASHAEATSFNNPDGENYHRFTGNIPKQLWAMTAQWADAVLYGTFITHVEEGKASGGTERVVHTEHRATHDAKNRFGLQPFITIPGDPAKIFATIFTPIISKG